MKAIIISVILAFSGNLLLAQFSATMNNVVSGKERIYQVFSDGDNYRYEFSEQEMDGVVIVKPEKNETNILIPEKKFVHRTTCDDMMSRMNDPVQSVSMYQKAGVSKDEGEEELGDFLCQKSTIYQGDTKLFTVWNAEKLNFPMKIENHLSPDTHMELVNIKKWDVIKDYFIVPPGYTEVDDKMRPIIPEPPVPEKWNSKQESMPFEGKVKRGEKITLTIPANDHYKFLVRNDGDSPTKYIYHLYENGEKLPWDKVGNDDRRSHRFFKGEKRTFTYDWEKDWLLIVEVYEGELMLEVYPEKPTIN